MLRSIRTDKHLGEVLRAGISAFSIRLFGTALGFLISVIVARMLGANGAGVYYLALSVAAILSSISRVGLDNAVVRFTSMHASMHEWKAVWQTYKLSIRITIFVSIICAITLYGTAEWVAHIAFDKPELEIPLKIVAIALLPMSTAMIQAESLRGVKKIRSSQWIKTVYPSLGILVLIYPFVSIWGNNGAVAAFLAGSLFAALMAWGNWISVYKRHSAGAQASTQELDRNAMKLSIGPLFFMMLSGLMIMQGVTVIVGILGTTEQVGIFNTANRVAGLLLFPLMGMISILSPKFAEMSRRNDIDGMRKLSQGSSKILGVVAIVMGVLVAATAEKIMLIFGADFSSGAYLLMVLLAGVVVNTATGAVAEVLMMTGNERAVMLVHLMGAIMLFVSCPIFFEFWGLIGAAISLSATNAAINLAMLILVRRKLGFWAVAVPRFNKLRRG